MRIFLPIFLLCAIVARAQEPAVTTAAEAPNRDTSYIDEKGTAHITRVVAVPEYISAEAQKALASRVPDAAHSQSLEARRARMLEASAQTAAAWSKICPTRSTDGEIAGIKVHIVTPSEPSTADAGKVLINLHGGGFTVDSGSLTESIPVACDGRIKVVSVLYSLAPEHPFPAALNDAVAVYRELLKSYKPVHIGIFGTSAGAMLTAEVAVKLKALGLPIACSLGYFQWHGRLRPAHRLRGPLLWRRFVRASRPTGTRTRQTGIRGINRSQKSRTFANLR